MQLRGTRVLRVSEMLPMSSVQGLLMRCQETSCRGRLRGPGYIVTPGLKSLRIDQTMTLPIGN